MSVRLGDDRPRLVVIEGIEVATTLDPCRIGDPDVDGLVATVLSSIVGNPDDRR
jgi:hypothetical protein